jgi:thymidylate synthase
MKQYLDLMERILDEGDIKNPARELMPRTKELFGEILKFNLQEGFPLLTTKKMFTKGVIEELLWFLRGSTNVSDLIEKGVNIWNEDTYQFYVKNIERDRPGVLPLDYEEWVNEAIDWDNDDFRYDCGKIYGYHWRNWNNEIDQIVNLVNMILKTPDSRYQIVTAWNPSVVEKKEGCLPSCHILFQTSVRYGKYLDLNIYQRSCDYMLGVPYNIASYAFLIHILCLLTGYEPGVLKWIGGSVHIYENQVEGALEQLKREPLKLPDLKIEVAAILKIIINKCIKNKKYTSLILEKIFSILQRENFVITGYESYPTIKFPLSTGLKLDDYKRVWDE